MTNEERLEAVEHQAQHHNVAINLLVGIAERQHVLLERIEEQLKEAKRDTAQQSSLCR